MPCSLSEVEYEIFRLIVVRLRQHEHQRPTLVLLASRRKPQEHKNGSICKTAADASKPEAFLAGVQIAKPLQCFERQFLLTVVFPERVDGSAPQVPVVAAVVDR